MDRRLSQKRQPPDSFKKLVFHRQPNPDMAETPVRVKIPGTG